MPKQLYKITQFHGGLNSSSDARDISDNELSEATDVMVDELGKIRLMGGITAHVSGTPEDDQATGWNNGSDPIVPGYGLFYFSHDRIGGENKSNYYGVCTSGNDTAMTDSGASFILDNLIGGTIYNQRDNVSDLIADNTGTVVTTDGTPAMSWAALHQYHIDMPNTGDDYLCIYDDNDQQVWLYSRVRDAWDDDIGTANSAVIDLGTTAGAKPCFYAVDGALRISDGNFGTGNTNKWYGYISRRQFGNGTDGLDVSTQQPNGSAFRGWTSQDQNLTALAIKSITTRDATGAAPDIDDPVRLAIKAPGAAYPYYINTASVSEVISSETQVIRVNCNVNQSINTITMVDDTSDNFASFCIPGDFLIMGDTDQAGNANVVMGVSAVTSDVITVGAGGGIGTTDTSTLVTIANLSRMHWWSDDTNERYLQFAMSTIYDGNQESGLAEFGTRIPLTDIIFGDDSSSHYLGLNSPTVDVQVFTSTANTFGSTYPRVTGFKIYVRRSSSTSSSSDYYLLSEVSIEHGIKISEHQNNFSMWSSSFVDTNMAYFGDKSVGDDFPFPSLIKYPYEVDEIHTVEGYKTAVIANRMAYIGHVKQDGIVYGDRVLKSEINKFDSFPASRIIEASVNDGDSIVKLEAYADRLLIFKKNKLELVNISQEVEFLEDIFMHKGVSHPAATCKTDFGIAWVNKQGCYMYDGQKVNNLLEKAGRQIIKESEWSDFVDEPMIGYIPKKRQIIVSDDITTTGDGAAYLYDMVTQSWVKGADDTITDQTKTNFITDWNGDLVYAHTAGTLVKWDDAGDDSTAFVLETKDIDFGQPAQKKRVYKVYVTYTGVDSLSVNVDYQINGDNGWNGFASGEPLTGNTASGQNEATLTLSSPVECYSFQLKFSGTGKTAFEINDVSIVFRLKGQR